LVSFSYILVIQITAKDVIKLGTKTAAAIEIGIDRIDICDGMVVELVPLPLELTCEDDHVLSIILFL
jgi:hypothetical protein